MKSPKQIGVRPTPNLRAVAAKFFQVARFGCRSSFDDARGKSSPLSIGNQIGAIIGLSDPESVEPQLITIDVRF